MTKKSFPAICLLALLYSFTGCISFAKKKFKLSRKFDFASREPYFRQISRENEFDPGKLIYLDSASYMKFASNFTGAVYYGSFVNDSIQIKKDSFLLDNESCGGRIDGEIERIISSSRIDTMRLDSLINLGRFNFFSSVTDNKINPVEKSKKLTILLIYFYSFGTYYKSLYKEIEIVRKKYGETCEVYIVSLDPVCYLKP